MRSCGDVPHLPGVDVGVVRKGGGGAPERGDAVPPLFPVCSGEAVRLLDREGVPRGVRDVLLLGDPVQPRERAPRRDVRDTEDHAGSGTHRAGSSGETVSGQPRLPAGLGLREGLCGVHVADPAAGGAGGLRDRDGRAAHGAGIRDAGVPPRGDGTSLGRRRR